jgi:hypothetical protein
LEFVHVTNLKILIFETRKFTILEIQKTTEKKISGLNIFGLPSSNIGLYYFTNPLFCKSGLISGVLPVKSLNA